MPNKNTTHLLKSYAYIEEQDFYVGYHLFCLHTPIFHKLFEEIYHPQFLQVLSTLSNNSYFKDLLTKRNNSYFHVLKTIFYISAQECWSHLLFIYLNSQTHSNNSNTNYKSALFRHEFEDYPSIKSDQLSTDKDFSFANQELLKRFISSKQFKEFFWEEQVGIPDSLKKHTDSKIIVDSIYDFLSFSWHKHKKTNAPITIRAIKKLLRKLKTDLSTDISFRIEFEKLRYSIENAISNNSKNTIETIINSIEATINTIDDYQNKQQKRITFEKNLQNIVHRIIRNADFEDDFKSVLSSLSSAWDKTKNRKKSDEVFSNETGLSEYVIDVEIKELLKENFIDKYSDDVCNFIAALIEKRLKDSKKVNIYEKTDPKNLISLKEKLAPAYDNTSELDSKNQFSKIKESSYIYKFLFELIIYYTSKYHNIFFITVFEETAQELIKQNKLDKKICEQQQVLQQLYASTLGIYGLSKRKISDFRSSRSKTSLKISKAEKNALNTMHMIYTDLHGKITGGDRTKTLQNLAACQKFFTAKSGGASYLDLGDMQNFENKLEQTLSVRLERLNSLNGNRKDENFNIPSLFQKIERCKCTDDKSYQARLSMILGVFNNMLLNIDSNTLNPNVNDNTQNLPIIEQLETLDIRIAKVFCLLNWDLKLIVDAIANTIKKINSSIRVFEKTSTSKTWSESNEITSTIDDANTWDKFCLKYSQRSPLTVYNKKIKHFWE